ncbi:hypothetical protein [Metabacillus sediminilitoris]|nr:hypothetical protein [Metabacillus sediminilitoris]
MLWLLEVLGDLGKTMSGFLLKMPLEEKINRNIENLKRQARFKRC